MDRMIAAMARHLLVNARIATMRGGKYSMVDRGAITIEGGRIAAVDAWAPGALPHRGGLGDEVVDLEGALVTPGLIDCHTHLVFAGNRAREFEQRLNGASYEEIARAGGGIVATVAATRKASEAELLAQAGAGLDALVAQGGTTGEHKNGYGVDEEGERQRLRVARGRGRRREGDVA